MGKATIQSEDGAGLYTVKMVYAGRAENQARIEVLNAKIAELQIEYDAMPETTPDEIFAKQIKGLQIKTLEKQVEYLTTNFPADPVGQVYCVDFTEDLTGNVGLIEVPGEYENFDKLNIVPGYPGDAAWSQARDGQIYPNIAMGPWASFLNRAMLPGWQKWFPLYRYGKIVADSIDFDNNTCDICLDPEFSSQRNLPVNQNEGFTDCTGYTVPQFNDLCTRYPTHPT